MPCIVRSDSGVRKTVKLVGTNTVQQLLPGQITVGRTFVVHPAENFVTHTFDACLLSSARTGACATLALQLLAPRSKRVAIIGAGRVGYYAASYVLALGLAETLYLDDADPVQADALATELNRHARMGQRRIVTGRPEQPVDAVIIATTSHVPIYGIEDFVATTVISLGADATWQHELDPAFAAMGPIYVDTLDSVRYGDLHAWTKAGLVTDGDLVDLLALVRDGISADDNSRRVFISTGSALFDNLTTGYLLSQLGGGTL